MKIVIPALLLSLVADGSNALVPPPQRSLDVPPINDPSRTAILTGVVPIKSPTDTSTPDGLRSVVWVTKTASTRTPTMPRQVMVLGAWGFRPATIVVTPRTEIELRGSEPGIRTVRSSGVLSVERRLNRATNAMPLIPERAGVIDLKAERTADALDTRGSIVVVDTPFCTVADAKGAFQIVGLPPGRNQVKVRLPNGKEFERTVELRAGSELVVDWQDIAENKPAPRKAPAAPAPADSQSPPSPPSSPPPAPPPPAS